MRYTERFEAQQREKLHEELCRLIDQLFELSHKWWRIDPGLADAYHDRYRIKERPVEQDSTENWQQLSDDEIDF